MKHQGQCKCGAVKVGLLTDPLMKFNCHCSHCRGFASKYHEQEPKPTYNPTVFAWRWSAKVEGNVEYEHTVALGGLFAIKRGRCASCKQPMFETGGRVAAPYAMVMAEPLGIAVDTNLYYDSGVKEGPTDNIRVTIHSDIGSLLYEIWIIMTVGLAMLPFSIFALFQKHTFKKSE